MGNYGQMHSSVKSVPIHRYKKSNFSKNEKLNALVRGINTDNNSDRLVCLVLEMCFLVVFLLEFLILCGTEVDCVVQKSIVYYRRGLCSTEVDCVVRKSIVQYRSRLSSTEVDCVVQMSVV